MRIQFSAGEGGPEGLRRQIGKLATAADQVPAAIFFVVEANMRFHLMLTVLLYGASSAVIAEASRDIAGRASVVDGDTIELQGERVRLNGTDAPESAQLSRSAKGQNYRCGAVAARALEEFLSASRPTRCKFVERDRYGRFVGDCYRADGASVAELLVLSGWELDWPRYSKGEYGDEQSQAKAKRAGMWSGTFTAPWEWRAMRRANRSVTQPSVAN